MAAEQIPGFCIIADVMHSRHSDKKDELRRIAESINGKFAAALLTPFAVRSGDELFGVLRAFPDGYRVLKELLQLSGELKVPLYVGAGIGFVADEDLNNPHAVNGSAIWSAAEALKLLKNEKSGTPKSAVLQKTFKLHLESYLEVPYQALNYQFYFLFERMLKRTDKQKEVVKAVELSGDDANYEAIGERFGFGRNSGVNVSKLLARADYQLVAGSERSLCELLGYFQRILEKWGGRI